MAKAIYDVRGSNSTAIAQQYSALAYDAFKKAYDILGKDEASHD